MTTRDEAVGVLAEHRVECTGLEGVTCRGCRDAGWMSLRVFTAHIADALAAAGLLRPNPTGEDREVLRVVEEFRDCVRAERDGDTVRVPVADLRIAYRALTARSRGPETGQPAEVGSFTDVIVYEYGATRPDGSVHPYSTEDDARQDVDDWARDGYPGLCVVRRELGGWQVVPRG